MKATGIISALIFAHAAFAQAATDTSSASVSAAAPTPNAALNTPSGSAAASATSGSASAYGAESSSASSSGTKKGSKPSSAAGSSVAPTPSAPDAYAGATGTQALPLEASQAASGGANPFIPSDVSPGCATYMNALNSDSAISSCLNSLLTTLAPFTGGANPPASQVPKALGALCGSTACSISTMQSKLVEFATACSDELTGSNPNQEVVTRYDTMYAVIPFKSAICTKDVDTQTYCVLNPSKGSNSTGSSNLAVTGPSEAVTYARDHLSTSHTSRKRAQTVLVPNVETYRNSGLMYLFATPDMNAGQLCTSCTSQVLSKYIAFQNTVHYALGAKNSPLLGGQSDLWSAIQEKCPSDFATEVRNSAGVTSADQLNGASPAFATSVISAFAGALVAVVALV